jgi:hypothetical protein
MLAARAVFLPSPLYVCLLLLLLLGVALRQHGLS